MVGAWKAAAELARARTDTASFIFGLVVALRNDDMSNFSWFGSAALVPSIIFLQREKARSRHEASVDCLAGCRIFRAWNDSVETPDLFWEGSTYIMIFGGLFSPLSTLNIFRV